MIDRRAFLGILGLLAAARHAGAQTAGKTSGRIGFLGNADPKTMTSSVEAFRQGLRDVGLIEGQNVSIEYRFAEGQVDRLPALAAALVRLNVDVIVVSGTPAIRAAQEATRVVPIVVAAILVDPVRAGFVTSLARPGGNITGLASEYDEIVTRHVQLLAEAVPTLSRMVLLSHTSMGDVTTRAAVAAADKLGLRTRVLQVGGPADFEGAFRTARADRAQAMLVLPSPFFSAHRRTLVKLAATYRLPAFYELKTYVQDGGLISYGPSIDEMFRRAASLVHRILKGTSPRDLPVERPSKFELVINLKTARALGLTIPPSLLQQADQVIE
jgi:putative tryptophan/tyrosine transport system substrate-binding protein